jgi:hypothetical protein
MPNTPPLLLIPSNVPLFVLLQNGLVGEPMQLKAYAGFRVEDTACLWI